MLAFHQYGEPQDSQGIPERPFQLYSMRTAQCLPSGDIAKRLPCTAETLRLNATAELNRKDDDCRGSWIMTGRAAINMGYHRDPSQSSGISVLQAEYRRRALLSVIGTDNMASFLGGFPRISSSIHSDTAEPRNVHDSELKNDMTVPPPSRPLAELTPAAYLIVKGRLFRALGRVSDLNGSIYQGSYETVLEIDRAMYDAYDKFPSHMKVALMQDGNSPVLSIVSFSNLSLLSFYHKGLRRQFPNAEALPDSSITLNALEKSCALWSQAVETRDEVARVYLVLAKLLSGYKDGLGAETESSLPVLPNTPPALAGASVQFSEAIERLLFEQDLTNADFDWATLDAFIEETSYETHPLDTTFAETNQEYM